VRTARPEPLSVWELRGRTIDLATRTAIMGIVNVTPDSFSDGGRFLDAGAAVVHGLDLAAAGADLVDVGGESTRPGARPVPAGVETERVLPVVAALAAEGVLVSVDTRKAAVAAAAIDAGAVVVNAVGGLVDPEMRRLCARTGVGVVIVHMQGEPATMQDDPRYDDVVTEVATWLDAAAEEAIAAGIDPASIVVDPGIGFGKTTADNLELLARLDRIAASGRPVLVGASRKSFLGAVLAAGGIATEPSMRDEASRAAATAAILAGAAVVRVHDVAGTRPAVLVADAIVRGRDRREHR